MKIDVLHTWPRNCDYPLWRQMIRNNRHRFERVITAFMETNQGHDYREFVVRAMAPDNAIFFNAPIPMLSQDWRDLAVNASLKISEAEWVWFTEQDFYPLAGFWDEVEKLMTTHDVVAVYQGTRLHPCCIFAKRSTVEMTGKDFGIVKDRYDHFWKFQNNLDNLGIKIAKIDERFYYHFNGLSHNWILSARGEAPVYHVEEFTQWVKDCLQVDVPIDPEFARIGNAVITAYDTAKLVQTTPLPHSPTAQNPSFEAKNGDTHPIGEGSG